MSLGSLTRFALAFILGALPGIAQVATGDIAVVGVLTPQLLVLRAGVTTSYNLGSLGGSNQPFSVALDPNVSNSFLLCGTGFLGRATITGATTATYTLISGGVGSPGNVSWDGASFIAPDINTQQIVRIDPLSGAVTPVTTGPQPWGSNLTCATIDPATGRIFAGGQLGVWVVAPGASVAVPYASGWSTSPSSYANGIAMDVLTGDPVVAISGVNRVARIPSNGILIDLITSGSPVSGPTCIDVDGGGDFIVSGSGGVVKRVLRTGGPATTLGAVAGIVGSSSGVAVAKPQFHVLLTPNGGGAATLGISGIPAGSVQGWTVPSLDVSQPVGSGVLLGMNPDALSLQVVTTYVSPVPGGVFHWVGGVAVPLFPASSFSFSAGTFPPTLSIDVIALAINAAGAVTASPVHRASF